MITDTDRVPPVPPMGGKQTTNFRLRAGGRCQGTVKMQE